MGVSADGWIALAQSFIQQDGRAALSTVTRPQVGAYSTTTLTNADVAPLTYSIYCAPIDYGSSALAALKQEPGYNSTLSYKQLYIPVGGGYEPKIGDIVTLDKDWTILEILNDWETESVKCAWLVKIGG